MKRNYHNDRCRRYTACKILQVAKLALWPTWVEWSVHLAQPVLSLYSGVAEAVTGMRGSVRCRRCDWHERFVIITVMAWQEYWGRGEEPRGTTTDYEACVSCQFFLLLFQFISPSCTLSPCDRIKKKNTTGCGRRCRFEWQLRWDTERKAIERTLLEINDLRASHGAKRQTLSPFSSRNGPPRELIYI